MPSCDLSWRFNARLLIIKGAEIPKISLLGFHPLQGSGGDIFQRGNMRFTMVSDVAHGMGVNNQKTPKRQ